MSKSVFQSQLEDQEALSGLRRMNLQELVMSEAPVFGAMEATGMANDPDAAIERLRTGTTNLEQPLPAEAIVMLHGYPSLLIQNGDYEEPQNPAWQSRLNPNRERIKHVIANTGRVDLVGHRDYKWVGTCWRVSEDTFVTNRHVAEVFAEARANGFAFIPGITAYVDLAEEHLSKDELEYLIASIVHIEDKSRDSIDMAVMRIDPSAARGLRMDPIALSERHDQAGFIGVVGYPAQDFRNPQDAMSRIFRGIYNVKRLAPGRVMDADHERLVFTHNATTLGGNSGSVVFDVETGSAIGLHFAGNARLQNYAVKGRFVADCLRRVQVSVSIGDGGGSAGPDEVEERRRREDFSDRDGYRADFLGDDLRIALPMLNPLQEAKVARTGQGEMVLR
jgi:endonuclease G